MLEELNASDLCNGMRQTLLSLPKNAGLRVVVALPRQLSCGAVSQPHVHPGNVVDDLLSLSLNLRIRD